MTKQAKTPKQSREHNLNRTLYNLHKYNEENGTRLRLKVGRLLYE